MFEKVNPMHPDKIADRIAGAIVDKAYAVDKNPKVAVEVLIGHGICHIINETSEEFDKTEIENAVKRISRVDNILVDYKEYKQDSILANNQSKSISCGDNGIFKGVPTSKEELELSALVKSIYKRYPYDGKYIIENNNLTVCQSRISNELDWLPYKNIVINPIGSWTGGIDVDSGATNRKLGSDMGRAVTGGGLHGKDLSKADVTLNIVAYLFAHKENKEIEVHCNIGAKTICINGDDYPYSYCVEMAKEYITFIGGFERLAEWGLI